MKHKKVVALSAALTMLGSLGLAVPASAADGESFTIRYYASGNITDIAEATVQPNGWAEISGEFTAPSDLTNGRLEIISNNKDVSFYVDDASVLDGKTEKLQNTAMGGDEKGVYWWGTTDDWNAETGSVPNSTIASVDTYSHDEGGVSAYVSNLTKDGAGIMQYLNSNITTGTTYTVKAYVYYVAEEETPVTESKGFTIQYHAGSTITPIATANVAPNTWTEISGAFTAPADLTYGRLEILSNNKDVSFYVDDASVLDGTTEKLKNTAMDGNETGVYYWGTTDDWDAEAGKSVPNSTIAPVNTYSHGEDGVSAYVSNLTKDGAGIMQYLNSEHGIAAGTTYTVKAYIYYATETPAPALGTVTFENGWFWKDDAVELPSGLRLDNGALRDDATGDQVHVRQGFIQGYMDYVDVTVTVDGDKENAQTQRLNIPTNLSGSDAVFYVLVGMGSGDHGIDVTGKPGFID